MRSAARCASRSVCCRSWAFCLARLRRAAVCTFVAACTSGLNVASVRGSSKSASMMTSATAALEARAAAASSEGADGGEDDCHAQMGGGAAA